MRVAGEPVDFEARDEHVILPAEVMSPGHNVVDIEFTAGDGSLNRQDDFLYTLFVPDRARVAVPLFDQPDLKARLRLQLDVPAQWRAVANGSLASREVRGERAVLTFTETHAISSYLFAFAAGEFQVEEAERDGRPMAMYHRETDRERVERNAGAIFDLHASALAWLEEYTGIPFPFEKFDFVLVPAFQYGGMEHPGAIFYRADSLLLDESATQNAQLGRASLIAHETAHQWFGDLVTMTWFSDVWMKETFANFMAAKIVNPTFPEVDHDLRFLLAHHPAAYGVDRTAGANPIRQPLDNLNEAGTLYGAIIYQKAPIRLRPPGAADRGADAARRPPRVPGGARLCQRELGGPGRDPRPADGGGPGGLEPDVGGRERPAPGGSGVGDRRRRDRTVGGAAVRSRGGGPPLEPAARPAAGVRRW